MTQGDRSHVLAELSRTKTCTQTLPAGPEHASFNHIPAGDSGAGRQVTQGILRGLSPPSSIFSGVLASVLPEGDAKGKGFAKTTTAVRGHEEGTGWAERASDGNAVLTRVKERRNSGRLEGKP